MATGQLSLFPPSKPLVEWLREDYFHALGGLECATELLASLFAETVIYPDDSSLERLSPRLLRVSVAGVTCGLGMLERMTQSQEDKPG